LVTGKCRGVVQTFRNSFWISGVKTHYNIDKMLSQGNFCKIFGFINGYETK
jgi:hypothetical protein